MGARVLGLMLVLMLTGGCAGDDGAPSNVCGPEGCSAECEQLRGGSCDILDEACRQRILDAVICVRGTPGEMPDVRTITEDEYRAELVLEAADEDAVSKTIPPTMLGRTAWCCSGWWPMRNANSAASRPNRRRRRLLPRLDPVDHLDRSRPRRGQHRLPRAARSRAGACPPRPRRRHHRALRAKQRLARFALCRRLHDRRRSQPLRGSGRIAAEWCRG